MEFTYNHGEFLRRITSDGTLESVCSTCFVTVSRTCGNFKLTTEELNKVEAAHICDQRYTPAHPKDSN